MNIQANNLLLAGFGEWVPFIFFLMMIIISGLANANKNKKGNKPQERPQRPRPRRANVNAELQNEIDNFLREVQGRPAKPKPQQQQPPVVLEEVVGQQRGQQRPGIQQAKARGNRRMQHEVEAQSPPQPEQETRLKDHHLQTTKKKARKKFTTNVSQRHIQPEVDRTADQQSAKVGNVAESLAVLQEVETPSLIADIHETIHDPQKIQTAWIIHEILSPPKSMRQK